MSFLARAKRKFRTWLEDDLLTERERDRLKRIEKLERQLEAARRDIHDMPQTIRHDLRGPLQNLKRMQSDVRRLDRSAFLQNLYALQRSEHAGALAHHGVFSGHEMQVFSQNGEDGILMHVFARIGTTNRRFVEIGAGGLENNTNNLFFNLGWSGFWIDMDQEAMYRLATFVARNYPNLEGNYRIHVGRVMPDSVDALVADYCRGEDPDLLTVDIDSFDGQVLEAIESVRPRVVGCEYNAAFGLHSVMVPFSADFSRMDHHRYYYGASLPALAKIAAGKGYALIGCDSHGVNCFFVREDLVEGAFDRLSPDEAFVPNRRYAVKASQAAQWQAVEGLPLVSV